IVLILAAYILYSRVSRKDTNTNAPVKWIIFMILAALTGALSAGFDKYLLQIKSLPPLFVLFWFLFYLMFIYGIIVLLFWFPNRIATTRFSFRYSIMLVGLLLVVADIVYMTALSDTNAKLALVSSIRRSNILISFIGGIILFKERNIKKKIVPFLGIIAGLLMIML
ncbi:MAG: hypothetical protein Q4F84_06975, partial [Fibrobacter sp.]|nr:hypothetical protein [Fibrobacter sp.]